MFTTLKKLFGGRPAKARKAAAGFRPALEALEGRDMPSAAGFSAVGQEDFYIINNTLRERDVNGNVKVLVANTASQVSVLQGSSHLTAHAEVLMTDGSLSEWDDATGLKFIAAGVMQVSAGFDGNSAVLAGNGNLWLYNSDSKAWTSVSSAIASASIGRDLNNGVMIDMVTTAGSACEWRTAGGVPKVEPLGSGVKQVSAGTGSHSLILYTSGAVWDHYDTAYGPGGAFSGPGVSSLFTTGVTSVSCGLTAQGYLMIDVVRSDGTGSEFNSMIGSWKYLGSGIQELDACCGGVTYVYSSVTGVARFTDNSGTGSSDVSTNLNLFSSSDFRIWMG
jgi:hypothetical protein